MEEMKELIQQSAIDYYLEMTESDNLEMIEDALLISNNQITSLNSEHEKKAKKYRKRKTKARELTREIEIVDKEKLKTSQYSNNESGFLESVTDEIKLLEAAIVTLKCQKAEKMQKLDTLQDLAENYKLEMASKKLEIESLKAEKKRYSGYKNSIQNTIKKHTSMHTRNSTIADSLFSVFYTQKTENNTTVSERSPFHSARSSSFFN